MNNPMAARANKIIRSKDDTVNIKKWLGTLVIASTSLSSQSLAAKSSDNVEITKLKEQLKQYQQQLFITNQRLQDLEAKDEVLGQTIKAKLEQENKSTGLTKGQKPADDTPSAKSRNVQADPDVDDPLKAGVPKSRYLNGFYDGGFSLRTKDNRFSLTVNGLAQARYTLNLPSKYTGDDSQTFNLALGRLFFSGTAFDPNLSYFFFYQTSTLANTNRVDTIDWWGKYQLGDLGFKAGRLLPQYSREFYTDIGKYLFMDLQEPEYAFSLQRTSGLETAWKNGGLTLSLTGGNSVRALDASGEQNGSMKISGIARANYDILDPYTYVQETVPDVIEKPQLSVGAAFGFNPVEYNSSLQNNSIGTDTYNATLDFGYRYQLFNTEAAVFWRQNNRAKTLPGPDTTYDFGWYAQAGYFLVPRKLELAAKANQIIFDYQDGSPFKNQTVGAIGLNYYFYEHNFKIQSDYSYIRGEDWSDKNLEDNRIRVQAQVYF